MGFDVRGNIPVTYVRYVCTVPFRGLVTAENLYTNRNMECRTIEKVNDKSS